MTTSRKNKMMVFSETKGGKVFVGTLRREKGKYVFEYESFYRKQKNAIPLGPEFPLWRRRFEAEDLFPSLADRIPSKRNPAYEDYCRQWGVDPNDDDPFVLLTTIGRRGPSTFVFERDRSPNYGGNDVKSFRLRLDLSQREFEQLFNISHATMVKMEAGKSKNSFLLQQLQLYDTVPEALEWLIDQRGYLLLDHKHHIIEEMISFHKEWRESPAARLMVPSLNVRLFLPAEDGGHISLAFGSRRNWHDNLKRLDDLVRKFTIVERATPEFRKRLEERWLDVPLKTERGKNSKARGRKSRRDVGNQVRAAWAELVVADYLAGRGCEIKDLEAWNKQSSDIHCGKGGNVDRHIEVKYFSESPKWFESSTRAIRGESGFFRGTPDGKVMNYAFSRLAKAAMQLKKYPRGEREVWFVIDTGFVPEEVSLQGVLTRCFETFSSWYTDGDEYPGIPNDNDRDEIIKKTPREWLDELDRFTIATMKDWRIDSIEEIVS